MLKNDVENFLEREPKFRERKNKDKGIVLLLVGLYPTLKSIDLNILVKTVQDYTTMDRIWRKVLEDRPALRGSDYAEKDKLEKKKQAELGY